MKSSKAKEKPRAIDTEFQIDHKGIPIFYEVSLCSFMYPGYGLQIKLSLNKHSPNIASEFRIDKTWDGDRAAVAEKSLKLAQAAITDGILKKLRANEKKWLKLQAGHQVWLAAEQKKQDALLKQKKAEGYTHLLQAWIHPEHGDDQLLEIFTKGEPSKGMIRKELSGSMVKNDYAIRAL